MATKLIEDILGVVTFVTFYDNCFERQGSSVSFHFLNYCQQNYGLISNGT